MRHDDVEAADRTVTVRPRFNDNGARSKSIEARAIPVSHQLIRLWGDYLHLEYGSIDSDYLFVNMFAEPRGRAWSYPAVYDLVLRLRARTGIDFDPHWFRHSMATRALRDGVPIEVVSRLLGHASVVTTLSVTSDGARRTSCAGGGGLVHRVGHRGDSVTAFPITDSDRSGWQRRAAGELVRVLAAYSDLPVITWTVGPAGSVLVGQVNALTPAVQVLGHFQTWRQALGLPEQMTPALLSDETMYLSASAVRNQVKVQLLATVIGGLR